MLDSFPFLVQGPPDTEETNEGSITLVVEDQSKKKRRLPSLYVSTYQVFADRDVVKVLNRFLRTVDAIKEAVTTPIYAAHPVRIDGRTGLYGKDFFSRATFRRKMVRAGVVFSEDPYPRLLPDGTFEARDWGILAPTFIIMPNVDHEEPQRPVEVTGASLLFNLLGLRFGRAEPAELYLLRSLAESVHALGCGDARALLDAVRGGSTT